MLWEMDTMDGMEKQNPKWKQRKACEEYYTNTRNHTGLNKEGESMLRSGKIREEKNEKMDVEIE